MQCSEPLTITFINILPRNHAGVQRRKTTILCGFMEIHIAICFVGKILCTPPGPPHRGETAFFSIFTRSEVQTFLALPGNEARGNAIHLQDNQQKKKAMTTLSGNTDSEKLADLSTKEYKAQAIWFLNAFWPEHGGEAEKIWGYKHTFDELDHDKKANGCALDELQAHRFLEKYQETLTVQSMREKLRSTGAIGSSFKLVPLIHILIFKYNVDWHELINAPQGNKEEVAKAQALLDE